MKREYFSFPRYVFASPSLPEEGGTTRHSPFLGSLRRGRYVGRLILFREHFVPGRLASPTCVNI